MAGSFPGAATFWTAYETAKAFATPFTGASAAPLIAAAVADVAVVGVRNPFEVVKQQMQSGMHKSTSDALRTILASDGVAGFYAGYASTVLREIPFDAIREPSCVDELLCVQSTAGNHLLLQCPPPSTLPPVMHRVRALRVDEKTPIACEKQGIGALGECWARNCGWRGCSGMHNTTRRRQNATDDTDKHCGVGKICGGV